MLSSITSITANSLNNNDHTGATTRHKHGAGANTNMGMPENKNKNLCPLSTGRKAQNYKSVINCLSDNQNTSFSRKLFSPQMMGNTSTTLVNG